MLSPKSRSITPITAIPVLSILRCYTCSPWNQTPGAYFSSWIVYVTRCIRWVWLFGRRRNFCHGLRREKRSRTPHRRQGAYYTEPSSSSWRCTICHCCSSPRVETSQKCGGIFLQVVFFSVFKWRSYWSTIPRGARSLQSCLGGGDIDGDDYNIIIDVCFFGFLFALSLNGASAKPAPSPYCNTRRL